MRDKSIEVRKIKGEENPADLFTKHSPSKDKVHQLVRLFGCEYRDGRAASAPLLRPMDVAAVVNNVEILSFLPHLQSPEYIAKFYPRMEAPEAVVLNDFGNIDVSVEVERETFGNEFTEP